MFKPFLCAFLLIPSTFLCAHFYRIPALPHAEKYPRLAHYACISMYFYCVFRLYFYCFLLTILFCFSTSFCIPDLMCDVMCRWCDGWCDVMWRWCDGWYDVMWWVVAMWCGDCVHSYYFPILYAWDCLGLCMCVYVYVPPRGMVRLGTHILDTKAMRASTSLLAYPSWWIIVAPK